MQTVRKILQISSEKPTKHVVDVNANYDVYLLNLRTMKLCKLSEKSYKYLQKNLQNTLKSSRNI